MAAAYRVTAPRVVLKVMDPVSGTATVNGFLAGRIVTDDQIEAESLKRHLDRGWLEKVAETAPEPKAPAPNPEKVPEGTAAEVRSWVGDNAERAALALAAEQKSTSPRATLVDQLKKLTGQA